MACGDVKRPQRGLSFLLFVFRLASGFPVPPLLPPCLAPPASPSFAICIFFAFCSYTHHTPSVNLSAHRICNNLREHNVNNPNRPKQPVISRGGVYIDGSTTHRMPVPGREIPSYNTPLLATPRRRRARSRHTGRFLRRRGSPCHRKALSRLAGEPRRCLFHVRSTRSCRPKF